MGYLQNFFDQVFQQSPIYESELDFEEAQPDQIDGQFDRDMYGEFKLTAAVRPSSETVPPPSQGYRPEVYRDEESGSEIPVIMAAASAENLFTLFLELIQKLGPSVDVVLESSHQHEVQGHVDFYREHIDTPVLVSMLYEYEDLLLNDGCTGIAVLNPSVPQEVQFDEHKLLIMYGSPLEPFEHVLVQNGVHPKDEIKFVTEAEHIHASSDLYQQQFAELKMRLGIDADAGAETC